MEPNTPVGVIGGSGLYSLLEDAEQVRVETPYGDPSDLLVKGKVGDREVVFLPRHGKNHKHTAHVINYRANLWALRSQGVRQVLGPCAVGSLKQELGPGTFVVPDQVVDRTSGRAATYFDTGAVHVALADPYCPDGRAAVLKTAADTETPAVDGGTMVVINGPRFSTRAESQYYARQDWSLINMTGLPEAALARELAMCYTSIALVTDLDAGVEEDKGVAQDEVFRVFEQNIEKLRQLVLTTVTTLGPQNDCRCANAHDGLTIPFTLPG
jgi:5'-methylthioadenosine phosphorylase